MPCGENPFDGESILNKNKNKKKDGNVRNLYGSVQKCWCTGLSHRGVHLCTA